MFRPVIFLLLLIVFSPYPSFPQDAGKTGLSFLKLSTGTRNAALGDNGISITNDLNSIFYNPALVSSVNTTRMGITYNKWIQDAGYSVFTLKSDIMDIPFAFGINTFSVPGIEIREKPGAMIGTFKAQYFAGTIISGYSFSDELSAGVGFKYLYEGLFSEEATGYAFDFGVSYSNLIPGLQLGLALRNNGSMNKLKNYETELPAELRAGGAYSFDFPGDKYDLLLSAELQKYLEYDDINFNFAAEGGFDNIGFIRLGYRTGLEAGGFTAGLGINWYSVTFEYAFIPLSEDLGNGNMIGIVYSF